MRADYSMAIDRFRSIRDALRTDDLRAVRAWCFDALESIMESDAWQDELFARLLDVMGTEVFCNAAHGFLIPKLVCDEWENLSSAQIEALMPVLHAACLRVRNFQTCFVLAEILGERLANRESLSALAQMTQSTNHEKRGCAAHGLGLLAQSADDSLPKKLATTTLRALLGDENRDVRAEAQNALKRLGLIPFE